MSKPSYDQEAVARIYARALYPLAEDAGIVGTVLEELEAFTQFQLTHPEFDDFLSSPLIPAAARSDALEKVFKGQISDLLLDTLQVLNSRDRCGLVPSLAETFREEFHLQAGRVDVEIRSAAPLSEAAVARFEQVMKDVTRRSPQMTQIVDEDLIGGFIVRVEDRKIDMSLAKDLRVLEQKLLDRASEEIHSGKYLAE